MFKILIIMKNHTNGITSEVVAFDSADMARAVVEKLRTQYQSTTSSTIREVVELY